MPWLLKSEPGAYSIYQLQEDGETCWDGVRNYQARNIMRDDMKVGDKVLFYHSNATPPGVVGVAEVSRGAYPDHTQFDPDSKYYDEKSDPDNPRWLMVDIRFVTRFAEVVPLEALKSEPELVDMAVVQRGQRLSVQPVRDVEFETVLMMAGLDAQAL